ncbi:MAG: ribosomal RNA small subunit methyltransferase A [Candidatus Brocadiae bacterium]|nr:ribosomal RNA small subunit methyltransferase A [Candidatus Brocadiia bacterium]
MDEPQRGDQQPFDIAKALANVRTQRDLAAVFDYFGMRPKRRFGQNFLIDHNLLKFVVRAAEVGPRDLVVDIGCGTGLLTAHLADVAGQVIGVEVDRRLFAIASRCLAERPNVRLLNLDVLAGKHEMAPEALEAIREAWARGDYGALRVVSNLPYSIASLVVANLLETDLPLAMVVVTVQKEVAERFAATPGHREYGALSVIVQAHARAELVRTVPPTVFWPRPQVQSAIARIVPEAERRRAIRDYDAFRDVVRGAFGHRRKSLANALGTSRVVADKAAAEALIERCGIEPSARAESLSVGQYIELANHLAD